MHSEINLTIKVDHDHNIPTARELRDRIAEYVRSQVIDGPAVILATEARNDDGWRTYTTGPVAVFLQSAFVATREIDR